MHAYWKHASKTHRGMEMLEDWLRKTRRTMYVRQAAFLASVSVPRRVDSWTRLFSRRRKFANAVSRAKLRGNRIIRR